MPALAGDLSMPTSNPEPKIAHSTRAVAISGTGNGDSFFKVNAVRTAAAIARFASEPNASRITSLQSAVTAVAGPHGMIQQSAEEHWGKTGENEGNNIDISFVNGKGDAVAEYDCGGMFRAWVDDQGRSRMVAFRECA